MAKRIATTHPVSLIDIFYSTSDMTNDASTNGHGPAGGESKNGSTNFTVKAGLAKMMKGGVIMDVVNAEQVLHIQSSTHTK